jgi:uncharacterized protein
LFFNAKSFDRALGKYYHARLMSNEFVIDSISFAKKCESLQGKIAVSSLERVRDDLASTQGEIEFHLQGGMDGRSRPSLTLSISGQVMLTCQRCLADLAHALNLSSRLVLVASEAELPSLDAEDEDADVVLASGKMNMLEILEDEIILALPMAPKHDFECVGTNNADDNSSAKRGPFSILGKPGSI